MFWSGYAPSGRGPCCSLSGRDPPVFPPWSGRPGVSLRLRAPPLRSCLCPLRPPVPRFSLPGPRFGLVALADSLTVVFSPSPPANLVFRPCGLLPHLRRFPWTVGFSSPRPGCVCPWPFLWSLSPGWGDSVPPLCFVHHPGPRGDLVVSFPLERPTVFDLGTLVVRRETSFLPRLLFSLANSKQREKQLPWTRTPHVVPRLLFSLTNSRWSCFSGVVATHQFSFFPPLVKPVPAALEPALFSARGPLKAGAPLDCLENLCQVPLWRALDNRTHSSPSSGTRDE